MSVTYDYYRIFYYVARYQSFTKAARVLMNSQPNITRAMNLLEQELGCRLFLRSHRGVTLTPEGELLYAHVRIAQEQLEAGEAELHSAQALQHGQISIGASEIALQELLLPVLRTFHRTYPNIHIRISSHATPPAIESVKQGLAEFAVVTSPFNTPKPLTELPLLQFQEILVAGPQFAHLANRPVDFTELDHYPIISLVQNTSTYPFYDRLYAAHQMVFQPDIEAAVTDQILPLVKYDLGLGFLPESFAREALRKKEVFEVKLTEKIPPRHISLVGDKNRPQSAAAKELIRMLKSAAQSEQPDIAHDFI